eukprot:1491802-Pleurochrysis_carterae.AAC.1
MSADVSCCPRLGAGSYGRPKTDCQRGHPTTNPSCFGEESANRINACKLPVSGPSSLRLCGVGEVSSGTVITYSASWKGEGQSPPPF